MPILLECYIRKQARAEKKFRKKKFLFYLQMFNMQKSNSHLEWTFFSPVGALLWLADRGQIGACTEPRSHLQALLQMSIEISVNWWSHLKSASLMDRCRPLMEKQ